MRKKFVWVSALLAIIMLLSACGSGNSNEPSNGSAAGEGEQNEKPYELTMAYFSLGSIPQDQALIEQELNKLTLAKINTKVKLLPISFSAWQNQVNLMLTSNEKLDLMPILGNTYANQVAKGQLVALDELLGAQGASILEALGPDYSNAAKVNGVTYAVPTIRDFAQKYGFMMPKEKVDKYNIDLAKVKTLDDLAPILEMIKKNEPNTIPLVNAVSGAPLTSYYTRDPLGDDMGVLLNNGDNLNVVNWFETEEYADLLKRMREWYLAGYIAKDAVTVKESKGDIIKAGKGVGNLSLLKPGVDEQESRLIGKQMVSVDMLPPVAKTSTVTNVMWAIAKNSENPTKAMEFLNLMYSDKEIINLLDYGIEGKHYVKVSENVIDYPEGVTAATVTYAGTAWLFGNQFLSYIFKGDNENIWEEMKAFNESAYKSKALGFTFDSSSVKTEYAAVTNVLSQYRIALECGALDPDKTLPDFISKLKDAGIDKIIAEKQKQLDAWASTAG